MGVGGGPRVTQNAWHGSRGRREALVGCVGRWCWDADDGGGEILFAAVQLQVAGLSVQAGTTRWEKDSDSKTTGRDSSQVNKSRLKVGEKTRRASLN